MVLDEQWSFGWDWFRSWSLRGCFEVCLCLEPGVGLCLEFGGREGGM